MASSTQIATGEADGAVVARVRLTCWGDFALADLATGDDLKPRGRKARALVAWLALRPGRQVSRERLTGLLWGDRGEDQARASLRQALLELKPLVNGGRDALVVQRDHVVLRPTALVTDIDELRGAATRGDYAALLAALPDSGERLFANLDGLDEAFDEWLAIERTRQREALITLLADASGTALAHGQTRHARALHARQHELDPASPRAAAEAQATAWADPGSPRADSSHVAKDRFRSGGLARWRWRVAALAAAVLLFVGLALAGWQYGRPRPAEPIALAVLPFRDLSGTGNEYFAEGVAEEVLGQLARNPRLKVTGRTSAWSFKGQALDAPTLGSKLGVLYLVEGSVRSAGPRVRVDVALVRARDGAQIWSERLDGRLDDLFAIQDRIGNVVSARLAGGATAPVRTAAIARGDAYSLYLTARGLFRTREPENLRTAIDLLRQAVKRDPGFALAWAQLGGAVAIEQAMRAQVAGSDSIGGDRAAERYVRHALALQPDLAEGHAMLGLALGFASPEARAHLKRAAQLDPHDSQKLFWLSYALAAEGDFPGRLNALRRAVAIDPTWHRTALVAGAAAWEMGYRAEGERYAARVPRADPLIACAIDFHMGQASGDYSRLARTAAAARIALAEAEASSRNLGFAALVLGQAAPARTLLGMTDAQWRLVLSAAPPDRSTLAALYRRSAVDQRSEKLLTLAVRQLLNAGRGDEIVRLFDAREGKLSASSAWDALTLAEMGPNMTLALRQSGRSAEAAQLLERTEASIRRSLRRGPAPHWYHAAAAQAWSAQGKREQALDALEKASAMGWNYVSWTPRSDIGDIPAFRPLLGEPRFERVRARLQAHIARERRETGLITV